MTTDPSEIVRSGHVDDLRLALVLLEKALELALRHGADPLEICVLRDLSSRLRS